MIIGTGLKQLGTKKLPHENCPECGTDDLHMTCYAEYFRFLLIPVFPTNRKVQVTCHNCGVEPRLPGKNTALKVLKERKKFRYPYSLFSGLVLVGIAVCFLTYYENERNKIIAEQIRNVQAADVIVFNINDEYSFGAVTEVKNDTIVLQLSNYFFEGIPSKYDYKTEKSKHDDFYNSELYYYSQKTIDSLQLEGNIYTLYRTKE